MSWFMLKQEIKSLIGLIKILPVLSVFSGEERGREFIKNK